MTPPAPPTTETTQPLNTKEWRILRPRIIHPRLLLPLPLLQQFLPLLLRRYTLLHTPPHPRTLRRIIPPPLPTNACLFTSKTPSSVLAAHSLFNTYLSNYGPAWPGPSSPHSLQNLVPEKNFHHHVYQLLAY